MQTGVVLFDAASLKPKADLVYWTAEGGTIWFGLSPFLVQNKVGFKIAKRGGGFGEIGLLDGADTELWKFKPTPEPSLLLRSEPLALTPRHASHWAVDGQGRIYQIRLNSDSTALRALVMLNEFGL